MTFHFSFLSKMASSGSSSIFSGRLRAGSGKKATVDADGNPIEVRNVSCLDLGISSPDLF